MPTTDGTRRDDSHGNSPQRFSLAKWILGSGLIGVALGMFAVTRRSRAAANSRSAPNSPAAEKYNSGSERVLQQLTRVRTASGQQVIRGTLVAEFAARQRSSILYVAFCPPFELLPEVEANIADESLATVSVEQRLHNGAQLEVKLAEPAEDPFSVSVDFFAADPEPR